MREWKGVWGFVQPEGAANDDKHWRRFLHRGQLEHTAGGQPVISAGDVVSYRLAPPSQEGGKPQCVEVRRERRARDVGAPHLTSTGSSKGASSTGSGGSSSTTDGLPRGV